MGGKEKVNSDPLVSIGMPLFNEGRFVGEALEALVSQDYQDIEIIISDNASDDNTEIVCRDYASRYDHIKYYRASENLGPTRNFRYVLEQSSGKYFMWAAGHDRWSKNCISQCVNILETHQDAAIAFPTTNWIGSDGLAFEKETGWSDTRGMDVITRYFTVFWGNMNPVLGLIRRDYLLKSPLSDGIGADLVLLTKLALRGDFIHAVNAGWVRREFRQEKAYKDKLKRYKSEDYKLTISMFDKLFPLARIPVEIIKGVIFSDIHISKKMCILFLLIPTLPIKYLASRK